MTRPWNLETVGRLFQGTEEIRSREMKPQGAPEQPANAPSIALIATRYHRFASTRQLRRQHFGGHDL